MSVPVGAGDRLGEVHSNDGAARCAGHHVPCDDGSASAFSDRNGDAVARGAHDVAEVFKGRARGAKLALIDGAPGAAWAPGGVIRVLVVARSELERAGLEALLAARGHVPVGGGSATLAEAREVARDPEADPEGPGAEVEVEEPWPGYDAMSAAEIAQRVAGESEPVRAAVRLYEAMHDRREVVMRATSEG